MLYKDIQVDECVVNLTVSTLRVAVGDFLSWRHVWPVRARKHGRTTAAGLPVEAATLSYNQLAALKSPAFSLLVL